MAFRDNSILLAAFASSIGMHILILPMVYSHSPPMVYPLPTNATHLKTPLPETPEVELGIDESKVSTLTWIGYKEYEEQLARNAEVEQAAMTTEVEMTQPMAWLMTMTELAKPITELVEQMIQTMRQIEITLPTRTLPAPLEISVPTESPKVPDEFEDVVQVKEPTDSKEIVQSTSSDRDADATSVIHISRENWESGKPLAAKGIVLRPRRPSFTANQLVAGAPSGLVAILHIDNRGKPIYVDILVSTGSRSIDRSIHASLFRWRASGDRIDALGDDDTVDITIHITFSR